MKGETWELLSLVLDYFFSYTSPKVYIQFLFFVKEERKSIEIVLEKWHWVRKKKSFHIVNLSMFRARYGTVAEKTKQQTAASKWNLMQHHIWLYLVTSLNLICGRYQAKLPELWATHSKAII